MRREGGGAGERWSMAVLGGWKQRAEVAVDGGRWWRGRRETSGGGGERWPMGVVVGALTYELVEDVYDRREKRSS